jgi:hypothetical protein
LIVCCLHAPVIGGVSRLRRSFWPERKKKVHFLSVAHRCRRSWLFAEGENKVMGAGGRSHTCVPLMAPTTGQHGSQECAGWGANLSQKRAPCLVGLGQDELLKLVKAQLHIAGGNGIVPAASLPSGVGGWSEGVSFYGIGDGVGGKFTLSGPLTTTCKGRQEPRRFSIIDLRGEVGYD